MRSACRQSPPRWEQDLREGIRSEGELGLLVAPAEAGPGLPSHQSVAGVAVLGDARCSLAGTGGPSLASGFQLQKVVRQRGSATVSTLVPSHSRTLGDQSS